MAENPFKTIESAPEKPAEIEKSTKEAPVSDIGTKERAFENEEGIKTVVKERLRALQKMPTFALPNAKRDEVNEIIQFPVSQQVGALISLVFEQGLEQAVATARALDNPAILDELHDALADQYWKQLVDKDIIKP